VSAFINEHRARFGVEPICRELEVSTSAYWARRSKCPSLRAVRDEFLVSEIRRVHAGAFEIYGQWKTWQQLQREELTALRKEVRDLRRANGILKAASVFFARELDQPRPR